METSFNIFTPISFKRKVLYENIDQKLQNKLHGPLYYKIGVTCVYNGNVFYTLCLCNEFMCV